MSYADFHSEFSTKYFTRFEANIFCPDPEKSYRMVVAARLGFSVDKRKGLVVDSMTLAIRDKGISLWDVLRCVQKCRRIRTELRYGIAAAWRGAMLIGANEECGIDYYQFATRSAAREYRRRDMQEQDFHEYLQNVLVDEYIRMALVQPVTIH